MALTRPAGSGATAAEVEYIASGDALFQSFPVLVEYLTASRWDDGSPRQTATLFVFFEGAAFKVMLNDRELQRKVFVSGGSFSAALSRLDRGLETGELDWRPDKNVAGPASARARK